MSLIRQATTTTLAAQQVNTASQLRASREVNRLEYEQRVQSLGAELQQVQLKRQQAGLQAQQQLQQNERSYAQGMYEILKQRINAQEQAFAGKEQGLQIQAETANQGTSQYRELLNAALQLEAQQEQERQKLAQASMFVDPLGVTNVNNQSAGLQQQVQAFMQNRMMNNQVIGDDQIQSEYAVALSEVLRKLGINDSELTNNMASQNSANLSQQYAENQAQVNQQTELNNQAFTSAEQALRDAQGQEQARYQSDDRNLVRLDSARRATESRNNMSLSGYTYVDGAWRSQSSDTPLLDAARRQQLLEAQQTNRTPAFTQQLSNAYQQQQAPTQSANNRLYLGNGSTAREELLRRDPNAVIIMPGDERRNK